MANEPNYKVGDIAPGGLEILFIYGQTDNVLVYRTKDNCIAYWIDEDELSAKDHNSLKRKDYLAGRVFDILPEKYWQSFQDGIGLALFNAFTAQDDEKSNAAFSDIETRIFQRTTGYSRFLYLLAALSTAVILGLIFFGVYLWYPISGQRIYALYIVFALAGSLASVIQRTSMVEIGEYEQKGSLLLRGAFRIILGGLLAAFFIAACKANILAGIAATSPWSFAAFSFLSGFSERFVPELLTQLEKERKK